MKRIVSVSLFLCLILSFYSNLNENAFFIQILSFSFLLISAILSLAFGLVNKIKINLVELMFVMMGIASCVISISNTHNTSLVLSSIVFLLAIISFLIISRVFSFYEMINIVVYSYVYIIFYILIFYFDDYIFSLGGGTVYGEGLNRFKPMNLHPNLVGFIFSGGAILFIIKSFLSNNFKYLNILCIFVCISFVLAASARAGLVAVFISLIFYFIFKLSFNFYIRNIKTILCFLGAILGIILYYSENLINYIINILELESDTRGVDSGGTGRVDLWEQGINYIWNNNILNFIFGDGFRYSSADIIGFSTESSYITIMIDHGILFSLLFFIYILFILIFCFFNIKSKDNFYSFVFLILFYTIIQSIFNRYLLALGNPFSIFIFFIYFYFPIYLEKLKDRFEDKFLP